MDICVEWRTGGAVVRNGLRGMYEVTGDWWAEEWSGLDWTGQDDNRRRTKGTSKQLGVLGLAVTSI